MALVALVSKVTQHWVRTYHPLVLVSDLTEALSDHVVAGSSETCQKCVC